MNILQIAGGEGSGKTTLAAHLVAVLSGVATVLTLDRYRRNKRPDDSPDFAFQASSIDWPLVSAHIHALQRGEHVVMPQYDLKSGRRLPMTQTIPPPDQSTTQPTDILIVDGLQYLQTKEDSIKIFVDASVEVRRERVRQRDTETGQRLADIFDSIMEPAYQRHTLPLREQADLVLDGTQPTEQLVTLAQRHVASVWSAWG